jgi:hypothetical protein
LPQADDLIGTSSDADIAALAVTPVLPAPLVGAASVP